MLSVPGLQLSAAVRDPEPQDQLSLPRVRPGALRQIKPKAFVVENVSGMTRANNLALAANQEHPFQARRLQGRLRRPRRARVRRGAGAVAHVSSSASVPTWASATSSPSPPMRCPGTPRRSCLRARRSGTGSTACRSGRTGSTTPSRSTGITCPRDRWRGWDQVSRTIVANSRHTPLHPVSPRLERVGTDEWKFAEDRPARRLSYREAARLQGFGSEMKFPDTFGIRLKYQRRRQRRSAPPLFKAVADALPAIW